MIKISRRSFLAAAGVASVAGMLTACGASSSAASSVASTASSAAASSAAAANFTTVEEGKLIMATNAAFPPYEMVKDDGSYEGIDVEIATAIATSLGLELEVSDIDFTAAIAAPTQGKADMCMAGLTVNEERKKNLDFTTSYAQGVQVVIVPEGSDIKTIDDLAGKLIGTQEGTTGYIYCSGDYGEDAVTAYTNGSTAVQALVAGKVDCVVIDQAPAQEFVKANPGLSILDSEYTTEDYAIAVAKGNTGLLDALNTSLEALIADGTVAAIVNSYISAN